MPAEKKEQIEKMFSKMDPNGNGYVEQPEFEKYLVKYEISLQQDRASYLFALIQSMNAEMREKGESSHNGNLIPEPSEILLSLCNTDRYHSE